MTPSKLSIPTAIVLAAVLIVWGCLIFWHKIDPGVGVGAMLTAVVLAAMRQILGTSSNGGGGSAGFARMRVLGVLAISALLFVFVVDMRPANRSTFERASVVQAEGCAWWNSSGGTVVAQQGGATLSCELAQVESGNPITVTSLLSCVGGVVADLVSDITSLITYYVAGLPDGGVQALAPMAMVCAPPTAKPPYPGAPPCISAAALAALASQHTEAVRLQSAGK